MHNLVPQFILNRLAQAEQQGTFTAVGLFVDISGFTQLMETLMQHGQHGAEVMASVMLGIFEPLVQFVFEQGGFIGNFAGDAFTAFFPIETAAETAGIAQRAITAAWQAQDHLRTHPISHTPYGGFQMTAKTGLALGETSWGILTDAGLERAAFYFRGTAVDGCALAEKQAAPGEIVLAAALAAAAKEWVTLAPRNGFFVLNGRPQTLAPAQPFSPPQPSLPLLGRFFPPELITQPLQGEFRQIVNVFISLPSVRSEADLGPFMQKVFQLQAQFGSVTSRLDFGDKGCTLLLFWGAPIAHETDIARALNFLLALQRQSQIVIRAGVTYRVAHAGFIGSPLHEEFTCYGSGVNLAARFMTSAPPGEIWLDAAVFERARHQFAIQFAGNKPFKGFAKAQPVYRLLGHQETAVPIFSGQMQGREQELATLTHFVRPLVNGRCAGALRIEGEAGIGKSRLAHAFIEQLSANLGPHQVFLCQTDQILRQSLNPLRYWLRRYFNQSPEQTEAENKDNFDEKLIELIAVTESEKLANELARTRSFLGALVDLHWPHSLYAQLEPQGRFENTLTGLGTLLQAECLQKPSLLVIEDVHWLDEDSRQFLQQLWQKVTADPDVNYPLAIMATSRPEQDVKTESGIIEWQIISLGQLTPAALNQLAEELLGGPVAPALQKLLANRGEGNPFFTEQIVRYLQEEALLIETDNGWSVTIDQQTVLPRDVHALLVARLDRLTARVKDGVQHAAVLGREFEVRLLAHMLRDTENIDVILREAERSTIWAPLNELRYLFRHALVRDAAYKMQLRARREALHQLAVAALETLYAADLTPHYAELAYHAEQAKLTNKARDYLHKAGDVAREAYQNNEALDYYGRALALTPAEENHKRYELLLAREKIWDWRGAREQQTIDLDNLSEIADELEDQYKKGVVVLRQARLAEEKGDYETEIIKAKEGILLAGHVAADELTAKGYYYWGTANYWQGNLIEAEKNLNQALLIFQSINDKQGEGDALFQLGEIAIEQGNFEVGEDYKKAVLQIVETLGNLQKKALIMNSLGLLAGHNHDYVAAQDYLNQALAIYQEIGNRRGEGVVLNNKGAIAHMLGNYNLAHACYEKAIPISREILSPQDEAFTLNNLGEALAKQDDHVQAKEQYELSLKIARDLGLRNLEAHTLHVYGETLLALNEISLAEKAFLQSLDLREELGQETASMLPPQLGLVQVAHHEGNGRVAIDKLNAILEQLASQKLDGLGDPLGFYWSCYSILHLNKDRRASEILSLAYTYLQIQAEQITDEQMRSAYLHNVPENRLILEAMSQQT